MILKKLRKSVKNTDKMSLLNCHFFKGKMGFADSDSLESVKDLSNKASNLSSGNKFSTFFRKQKKTPEFADVVDSAMAQEKMTKTKSTGNIMFKKKTKRNKSSQPNTTSELESTNDTDSNLTLKMTKTKSTGNILASFRKRMNSVKRSRSSSNRRLDVNINNSKQVSNLLSSVSGPLLDQE